MAVGQIFLITSRKFSPFFAFGVLSGRKIVPSVMARLVHRKIEHDLEDENVGPED